MGHERHAGEDALLSSLHLIIFSLPAFDRQRDTHRQHHRKHDDDGVISWPLRQKKKSPRPEQTLRIAPASSSSPVPQPSREQQSMLRAGLLAHGSPYSPCLPIQHVKRHSSFVKRWNENSYEIRFTRYVSRARQWLFRVSSPFTAAGPRGHFTLFPYSRVLYGQHNRREEQNLSSFILVPRPFSQATLAITMSHFCWKNLKLVSIQQTMLLSEYKHRFFSVRRSIPVALMCEVCQKKPVSGNNVSHANNKTRRVFNPNIQTVRAVVGKSHKRIRVCTRCLRSGLVTKAV